MGAAHKWQTFGPTVYFSVAVMLGTYFTFAAVQGDFGLFRRIQLEADVAELSAQLKVLRGNVRRIRNKTHRLSDNYLDLDLLDERVRKILGYVRPDEIVIH